MSDSCIYLAFWLAKRRPLWSTKSAQYVSLKHIPSSPRTEKSKTCSPSVDQAFLQVALCYCSYCESSEYHNYNPFDHSNLAYALIGNCLVEHVYPGSTYEQYVQNFILTPLGMTQTGFTFTSRWVQATTQSMTA